MKALKYISIIFILAIFSCSKDPCFKDRGSITTVSGDLPDDALTLYVRDNLDIEVYKDSFNHYEIEGGQNLVDHIEVKSDNGVITVRDNNRCDMIRKFDQDSKVRLYLKDLAKIDYGANRNIYIRDTLVRKTFIFKSEEGGGDVQLLLNVEQFQVESKGSFIDFTVKGKAESLSLYLDGSSWFRAEGFEVKNSLVDNRSTGDCLVRATESLNAYIYDLGNIEYYGDPDVTLHVDDGKGQLIKR